MTRPTIAIAFPKHEADREKFRALVAGPNGPKLPAIYEFGVDRPCAKCEMVLNVGPRVAATGVPVYCLFCAMSLMTEGDTVALTNLGNPDSKDEP
jgi:hypothetical protein